MFRTFREGTEAAAPTPLDEIQIGSFVEILHSKGLWGGMLVAKFPSGIALVVTLNTPNPDGLWVRAENIRVVKPGEGHNGSLEVAHALQEWLGLPADP